MRELRHHFNATRKSFYATAGFFMLLPVFYLISSGSKFELKGFLFVLIGAIVIGSVAASVNMLSNFSDIQKMIKLFNEIGLSKIGDGNFKLVEKCTGWTRTIEFAGTFRDENIALSYRFKRLALLVVPLLNIYRGLWRSETETNVRLNKNVTAETINKAVNELLTRK